MEKRGRPRKYATVKQVEELTQRANGIQEEFKSFTEKAAGVEQKLDKFLTNDWHGFITKDWWRMNWKVNSLLIAAGTILATVIANLVCGLLGVL